MSDHQRNIIFYVDDDRDDLDLFQQVVENLGETVVLFELGSNLLKAMHNPPPQASLVFLDLNMPVMSGFEVLETLKKEPALKDIPVIVLSTAQDQVTIDRCKQLGASFYICKPSSPKEMLDAVQYVLQIDWSQPLKAFSYCESLLQN